LYRGFFPTRPAIADPTLQSVFIRISKGYHHCDRLSSSCHRLLKPLRQSAYDATLRVRRAEGWPGAYRSSRRKKHGI
jgi:hypothetical protein